MGHKHLPSVVLTLGSINPQKGQKWGVFPKNFTEVQENRKFRNHHATAFEIFDTKVLKRRIFRPFSHVFTGGRTWRFLCDFRMAIWRTKYQMTLERKTARIKVVVSSSFYKMVKEFLRYLHSCRNGAIPKISPKTTKNDPTFEPPGGRTVRLRYVGVSFKAQFLSSLVQ